MSGTDQAAAPAPARAPLGIEPALTLRSSFWSALVLACFAAGVPVGARAGTFPPDSTIRAVLAERIAAVSGGADFCIVVGLIGPDGRRIVSCGRLDRNDPRQPDGGTAFEIGSVGKVFTALLLADMVQKKEVALADPAARYVHDIRVPTRAGRQITLLDLATHTSALPFMPEMPAPGAAYNRSRLGAFVEGYALPWDIGSRWEYSNLGYWLLGEALAARAGTPFERLLASRVIDRLGLTGTGFGYERQGERRLAPGHDAALTPAPDLSTLPVYGLMPAAGAGLFSTADDLSRLLAVAMAYEPSPLRRALDLCVSTGRPVESGGNVQALGWTVFGHGPGRLVFRDGGTLGSASCVAWDPARRAGVVVLSNQVTSVADIARHLLHPDFPLERPASNVHVEIRLEEARLDSCAGRYEAAGEGFFVVRREGDHLLLQSPVDWGLPQLRLRAESPTDFFVSELPLRVGFQAASGGHVTGIVVFPPRGQKGVPAARIGPE